jgi:lactoylglutathione lyase
MPDVSLTLLVLKTRQAERLRTFYWTIGIEFTEEQHGKGPLHFAGKVGGVVIEIYPLPHDGTHVDSSTRLGFTVENAAAVIDALKLAGLIVDTPLKQTAWGLQATVDDPDGRFVDICQRDLQGDTPTGQLTARR